MKKILVYILFCNLPFQILSVGAQSKAENVVLYSITEQNGLSDNQVNCFLQDSHGFMWIGTEDGLNYYNGSVIQPFKKRTGDTTQLIDNKIYAITQDKNGHIWIATAKGLSEYDPGKNIFHSFQPANLSPLNIMTDLCFDDTGNLWITSVGGLLEFIPAQQKFIRFANTKIKNEKIANRFNKIIIDDNKRMWLGGYGGLWQFFPGDGHFELAIPDPHYAGLINNLITDHTGNIWLGYWSGGLKLFHPDSKTVEDINTTIIPDNITGIAEIKNPNGNYSVWCDALIEYDPSTKRVKKHMPAAAEPTVDYDAAKLYASHDGLLWIGTDKGIRIMDPGKQFFHHHFLSVAGLTPQGIALLQKDDQLYVGGAGENFLKLYNANFALTKKVMQKPQFVANGKKVAPALLNLVREDKDHIWLCTENGLMLFNERTYEKKYFYLSGDIFSTKNFIPNIFIDSRGNHWVFAWRNGIWQVNINTGQFKNIVSGISKENNEEKKLLVVAAAEDKFGNIWFADLDEGLIFFNFKTSQFSKPAEKLFGRRFSLQNLDTDSNYVWGVTTGIVFRIEVQTKKIEQWPVPDEFNKTVTGFCRDTYNHLWITTTSGLLSFDKSSHSFKRYTANDGLLDNVMSGSLYTMQNGSIIYASDNYITEFDPAEILKVQKVPGIIITSVFSKNEPMIIEHKNNGEKYISLNYNYNNFTFNWTVLNYSNPLQNRFYCKLEGIDTAWKFVGHIGQAQYASLAPGEYIFKVKGATSDGILNETGDFIVIKISPPFWRTWWFITIVSLFLLTIFIVVVRYISQRNLKEKLLRLEKAQAIEKERNRISKDMHDDLGSGLTKIAIMSEVAKKQFNEPDKARQQLENISESSRELVDNLQDIIWVLNPKNDTLENLAAYIREYALKFFDAFGIEIRFNYPDKFPGIKLSEETRRNIFLAVKETINNVGKHAWCNKVNIAIVNINNEIKITLQDDGKGFDVNNTRQFGNGLINMRQRIEQIGGKYTILSEPGKGTTTTIVIPA